MSESAGRFRPFALWDRIRRCLASRFSVPLSLARSPSRQRLMRQPGDIRTRLSPARSQASQTATLCDAGAGIHGRAIHVRISSIAARERDNSCSPDHPWPAAWLKAQRLSSSGLRLASAAVPRCRLNLRTRGCLLHERERRRSELCVSRWWLCSEVEPSLGLASVLRC